MQVTFLSYFLASLIAYLGLLAGLILIKMAPEEQKPGKRYFILLKKILFFILFIPVLYYYKISIVFSLALLLFVVALMLGNRLKLDTLENSYNRNFRRAQKPKVFDKSYFIYFLFGIIFSLSAKFISLFILESVLIFLYGVPNASLALNLKKKNYYEIFVKNLLFFIPVIALYFVF